MGKAAMGVLIEPEDAVIADMIEENCVTARRLFMDEYFITLTVTCWLMKFCDDEKPRRYNCSI
jgi:hypothetical protein